MFFLTFWHSPQKWHAKMARKNGTQTFLQKTLLNAKWNFSKFCIIAINADFGTFLARRSPKNLKSLGIKFVPILTFSALVYAFLAIFSLAEWSKYIFRLLNGSSIEKQVSLIIVSVANTTFSTRLPEVRTPPSNPAKSSSLEYNEKLREKRLDKPD